MFTQNLKKVMYLKPELHKLALGMKDRPLSLEEFYGFYRKIIKELKKL